MRLSPALRLALVLALAALAVAWAWATAGLVHAPAVRSLPLGLALATAGVALCVGRGVVPHPLPTGFSLACVGASLMAGSASGLWLVSPLVMACAASLAIGLGHRRPGDAEEPPAQAGGADGSPLLRLPDGGPEAPTWSERLSVFLFVLVPWVALYEAVIMLGPPPDAVEGYLAFERTLPVLEWTEAVYASTYVVVLAAHVVAPTRDALRAFALRGIASMALVFPLFFALPLVAPPRAFTPHGVLGRVLAFERSLDTPAAAFPSFHVVWIALAAEVFVARSPRWRWAFRAWALAVALSCVTTGMHALVDVIGGALVASLLLRGDRVWERLRRLSERVANSWQERRLGPVRVINHGLWAGLAVGVGCAIAGELAGPAHLAAIAVVAAASLVCAGLWAQLVEGSPQLLRPYGYYGGVLGVVLGSLAAPLAGSSTWLLLGAFSVAGPWTQALGRLRCLVQGCCHGHEAPAHVGIRYTHPRSRVCRLAHLAGTPVHPTPLYSILWNALLALVFARLWSLHAPLHVLGGLYLLLTGVGRFPEEAWRGEPQTLSWLGLRLYQWIAVATAIVGALILALGESAPAPSPEPSVRPLALGLVAGALGFLATGVDFPESNRRFSRLA